MSKQKFAPMNLGTFEVAPLGIGTMMWGTTHLDSYLLGAPILTIDSLTSLCDEAKAHNITFFDTAEGYGGGSSEERLRDLQVPLDGNVVSTKFFPTFWRCTKWQFCSAVKNSCKRLGVNCIDVYYIHTPIHHLPLEFWVEAAVEAEKKGLIKFIGISNCDADQVRRAHKVASKHGLKIVSNQINMSLLTYNHPKLQETLKVCKELDIQIVAFSVLGQGLLSDTLTPEKFKKIRIVKIARLSWEDIQPLRQKLSDIGAKYQMTMAQVATNWVICKGYIALIGCKSRNHIAEASRTLEHRLSEQDIKELDELSLGHSTLSKPKWRRIFFIFLISTLIIFYKIERGFKRLFCR